MSSHPPPRVERAHRVLEYRLDQPRPLPPVDRGQRAAVDPHRARRRRQQAQHDARQRRFAAAGLADNRQRAPAIQRQRYVVHRHDPPRRGDRSASLLESPGQPDRFDRDGHAPQPSCCVLLPQRFEPAAIGVARRRVALRAPTRRRTARRGRSGRGRRSRRSPAQYAARCRGCCPAVRRAAPCRAPGWRPAARACTDASAARTAPRAGACSTISPAYITDT